MSIGLLASCGGENSAENNVPNIDNHSQPEPSPVTAVTKTYIETYSAEGRRVEDIQSHDSDAAALAKASRDMGLADISGQEDNYVISTYEWEHSLAMLAVGAGTGGGSGSVVLPNGQTFDFVKPNALLAIKGAMFNPKVEDGRLHEAMNNWDQKLLGLNDAANWQRKSGIWGHTHYLFQSSYLDTMSRYYGPDMAGLSFATSVNDSSQMIANWLHMQLGGSLDELLFAYNNGINERTRAVTLNLEKLNLNWHGLFDITQTTNERFELLDGTKKLVPTMRAAGLFDVAETDQYQTFQLPIQNSTLALLVIMPKADQFETIKSQLDTTPLFENIVSTLQPKNVTVYLPHFSITTTNERNFSPANDERQADFSGINGQGYLYLKQLVQMATINVAESGIQANAGGKTILDATKDEPASVWESGFAPPPTGGSWSSAAAGFSSGQVTYPCYYPTLLRPFIFAIRETTTSTLLYAGMWVTPPGPEMEPDWVRNWDQTCEEAFSTIGG
jgi:serpin B